MFGAEFWVAIAFLILMGVFGYVGVHRTILKALDNRADPVSLAKPLALRILCSL